VVHLGIVGYTQGGHLNYMQLLYSGFTSCSMVVVIVVSEKHIASILRVEKFAKQTGRKKEEWFVLDRFSRRPSRRRQYVPPKRR
jgi:hypothetical protein